MSLQLIGISKHYYSNQRETFSLKNINLQFLDHGFYAVVGPSGCGKSTLLNLIAGIEKSDSGSLKFNGKNVTDGRLFRYQHVGILFQNYNLMPIYDGNFNYQLPLIIKHREDKTLLYQRFGLSNETLTQSCCTLSGGEQQRIALCRALINNPQIIIADEPTGSLDEENGLLVMQALKKLSNERTIILVSHNEKLVRRYADVIITLKEGSIDSIEKNNRARIFPKQPFIFHRVFSKMHYGWHIARSRLKEHLGRFWLLIMSLTISVVMCTFSMTILFNVNNLVSGGRKQFADYNVLEISKTKTEKQDDTFFGFSQTMRPSINDMYGLKRLVPNINIKYNFGSLLRPQIYAGDGQYLGQNIRFLPLFNYPHLSMEDVMVNSLFIKKFANSSYYLEIDDNVAIGQNYFNFLLSQQIFIRGIVNETSLFNSPAIFYNYFAYETYLANTYVEQPLDLQSWLAIIAEAASDDPLSSYSFLAYGENNDIDYLLNTLKKQSRNGYAFVADNNAIRVGKAMQNMSDLVQLIITIFVILVVVAAVIVAIVAGYSDVFIYQKENAINWALGFPRSIIFSPFFIKNILSVCAAMFLAELVSVALKSLGQGITFQGISMMLFISNYHQFFIISCLFMFLLVQGVSFICFIASGRRDFIQALRTSD